MEHSMAPMWASTKAAHLDPTLVDTSALQMAALMVDHSADLKAGHSADSKVSKMVCLPVAAMDDSLGHPMAGSMAYCSDYAKAALMAVLKACWSEPHSAYSKADSLACSMVDRSAPHSVDPMDEPKAGYSDIP